MREIRFTLPVRPATKKTSNRIVSFGRSCRSCGKRPLQKVIPSEQFEAFEAACLTYGIAITGALRAAGATLPITGPIAIEAVFYREANRGDWTGYTNALADVLQTASQHRKGLGIIGDDAQIVHWDGTRLAKDARRPRIEVIIRLLQPVLGGDQ